QFAGISADATIPPLPAIFAAPVQTEVAALTAPTEVPLPTISGTLGEVPRPAEVAALRADPTSPERPSIFTAPVTTDIPALNLPGETTPPQPGTALSARPATQTVVSLDSDSTVPPLPQLFTAPVQTQIAGLRARTARQDAPEVVGAAPTNDAFTRSAARPVVIQPNEPSSPDASTLGGALPERIFRGAGEGPAMEVARLSAPQLDAPRSETRVSRSTIPGLLSNEGPPQAPTLSTAPATPTQPEGAAEVAALPTTPETGRELAAPDIVVPTAPALDALRDARPTQQSATQTVIAALPSTGVDGAETPDILVTRGLPDVMPPARPVSTLAPVPSEADASAIAPPSAEAPDVAVIAALPEIIPPRRPAPAEPEVEVAATDPEAVPAEEGDGVVLTPLADEIAALIQATEDDSLAPSSIALDETARPLRRPAAMVEAETARLAAEEERLAALTPSDRALSQADRPPGRPSGFAAAVAPPPAPAAPVVAAAPATAPVPDRIPEISPAPQLPTSASVARAATIENAIPMRKIALIGVFEGSGDRHALVRLASGRYQKVVQGDRIDGFNVAAISSDAIRLRRGGRDTLLVIP
ncbi:MAG: hypothetical protein AAF813_02945, partial [Pseudomonadota bacterium]